MHSDQQLRSQVPSPCRDIFLSHRSTDKDFVRRLASDIEANTYQGRHLLTWVDEAEIRPGQSVPGKINEGLERSRFVGLVMTPAYFQSESGWTDAEWHAALHLDPDNRGGRIIPLLVADCPYIPVLLRHLRVIDFRGDKYQQALQELVRVLCEEPLPRAAGAYRGQQVTPQGRIDRATLVAERAVPQADPDVVNERLYCNLLPVEQLPRYVYAAPIAKSLRRVREDGTEALPTKQQIKDAIRLAQENAGVERPFMPAFRLIQDRVFTFHNLESPESALAPVIEGGNIQVIPTAELLRDDDRRKVVVSLLNMAIARHASRVGLRIDGTKRWRFFFPPKDNGPNIITWIPRRARASRTVAKPCTKDGQLLFWRHLGAYLRILFLANKPYLQIVPTWVITEDGLRVKGGPEVGRLVTKWTGPERNLHVLYHVRFWTVVLRSGRGPISIQAGDQRLEISTKPAFVQQSHGIAHDQRDLMGLLDEEAPSLAQREDQLADRALEAELTQVARVGHEDESAADDVGEEAEFDAE